MELDRWRPDEEPEVEVEEEATLEEGPAPAPAPTEFPRERRLKVDAGGPGIRMLPEGTSLMENELLMALATLDLPAPPLPASLTRAAN